jgi:hypothetical protein
MQPPAVSKTRGSRGLDSLTPHTGPCSAICILLMPSLSLFVRNREDNAFGKSESQQEKPCGSGPS